MKHFLIAVVCVVFCVQQVASAYGPSINFNTPVCVTLTTTGVNGNQLIVGSNANRHYLLVENWGANPAILKVGSAIVTTEHTAYIAATAPGSYSPHEVPSGPLYMESTTGTTTVCVTEGL